MSVALEKRDTEKHPHTMKEIIMSTTGTTSSPPTPAGGSPAALSISVTASGAPASVTIDLTAYRPAGRLPRSPLDANGLFDFEAYRLARQGSPRRF
ncbi:hypothetical protein GCM10009717_05880 [Agromyces allii]|uniref:Uncharacterized protein n=2 Tax=Agromyces allii TaxID=393607 RepID=A0ABN2Q2X3_9MICO